MDPGSEAVVTSRAPYSWTSMFLLLLASIAFAAPEPDDSWSATDWAVLGALPVATLAASFADDDVRSFAEAHRGHRSDAISGGAKLFGEGALLIPGAAALWWAGSGERAPRLACASRNALESWMLAQLGIQVAKYSAGRARPWLEEGNSSWSGPAIVDSRHSFPSGHVGNAWSVLGSYALEYRDIPWVAWPLWGTATAVTASRIHDDEHWLSDVVFAAGIGWLSARAIRSWHATPDRTLLLLPTPDGWTARLSTPF